MIYCLVFLKHRGRKVSLLVLRTYTENSVDERVVTAVTHRQPMTTEKYDVDVPITVKKEKKNKS